jgi:hypothetical protein
MAGHHHHHHHNHPPAQTATTCCGNFCHCCSPPPPYLSPPLPNPLLQALAAHILQSASTNNHHDPYPQFTKLISKPISVLSKPIFVPSLFADQERLEGGRRGEEGYFFFLGCSKTTTFCLGFLYFIFYYNMGISVILTLKS